MSGLSQRSRVKSDFFMDELEFMAKIKDNLNTISMHTKRCLVDESSHQMHLRMIAVQKYLGKMTKFLKADIMKIKTHSNLLLDPVQN